MASGFYRADHASHDRTAADGGDDDEHETGDPRPPALRRHRVRQKPKEHDQRRRRGERGDDHFVARLENAHDQREKGEIKAPLRARQHRGRMRRHEPSRAQGTESGLVVVERGAAAAGVRVRDAREEPPVRWGCRLVALMQWVVRRDAVGSCHDYSYYGSKFMYEIARLPDLRSASFQWFVTA